MSLPVSVWKPNKETEQWFFFVSKQLFKRSRLATIYAWCDTLPILQQHSDDIWVLLPNANAKPHEMKEGNNGISARHDGFNMNECTEE